MQAGRGVEARKLEAGSARRVAGLQGTGLRDMCVKSLYTESRVKEMFPQTRGTLAKTRLDGKDLCPNSAQ